MSNTPAQVGWTDEQWNLVKQTVYDEANRARVAGSFLPLYGPLDGHVQVVPWERMQIGEGPRGDRLEVNDYDQLRLSTLWCHVELRSAQVQDPDLSSALQLFRRAANSIARLEDALVFRGLDAGRDLPEGLDPFSRRYLKLSNIPRGGVEGLLNSFSSSLMGVIPGGGGGAVVRTIIDGIGILEGKGHVGPFACVLGDKLFEAINTPTGSMVMPSDRVKPFLDGPLLRSNTLPDTGGVLISLSGNPIEIVVARDISAQFLQVTSDPRYLFRVSEKMVLRIKEPTACVRIG